MLTSQLLRRLYVIVLFAVSLASPLPIAAELSDTNQVVAISGDSPTATIQVSAFKHSRDAELEVARLKLYGEQAVMNYEAVGQKGMWYRVYVGRFDDEAQARVYAQDLKARGVITWSWVKTVVLPSEPTSASSASDVAIGSASAAAAAKTAPSATPPVAAAVVTHPKLRTSTMQGVSKAQPAPATAKPEAPATLVRLSSAEKKQATAPANTFSFKSQTTYRNFQRDTIKGENSAVRPLYQFLQMDYGNSSEGGWSAHAYGWGRYDMTDSDYFEKSADGELLYGYLEYSKPYSALRLNLGRQHIFAGVTNQSVDGLRLATGLGKSLTATVFGGVTAASTDTSSDMTYGGRLAFHPQLHYELGLSYQNTDLEGDPDQKAGVDFFYNWREWLTLQGLSSYNLDTENWREHRYSAALRYKGAVVTPAFQSFSYQDYFGTGNETNNLFHFLVNNREQITILGTDLQWMGAAPVRFGARFNHYDYEVRRETAAYYAGLLGLDLAQGSQLGAEVGRMDGQTPDNIYTLYRVFFFWDEPFFLRPSSYVSGDGIFQDYDTPVFGKENAMNYSLSAGLRFFDDQLEFKLTGLYNQDPYFDDDFEGIITLIYQY